MKQKIMWTAKVYRQEDFQTNDPERISFPIGMTLPNVLAKLSHNRYAKKAARIELDENVVVGEANALSVELSD